MTSARDRNVATRNHLFQFDATTWGWIHLILGPLVAFAGYGLLTGQTWARVVAITLADTPWRRRRQNPGHDGYHHLEEEEVTMFGSRRVARRTGRRTARRVARRR